MPSTTRRSALRALPALALGLSGCSAFDGSDDDEFPAPTIWRTHVDSPTSVVRGPQGTLVVGSTSPFSSDPLLVGLDPSNGEQLWEFTGPKARASPVGTDGEHAYVFSKAGAVLAVEPVDGNVRWETAVPATDLTDPGVAAFPPMRVGDTVVVPVSVMEDDVSDRLVGLAAADGSENFVFQLPASISGAPAALGESVVVPLRDATLWRIDASGERVWRIDTAGDRAGKVEQEPPLSDVAVGEKRVYVGSDAEVVSAYDATDGSLQWRSPLENAVLTRPLLDDGTLYVGAADHYLYGFDPATGDRNWRTEADDPVTNGPTAFRDALVSITGGGHSSRSYSGRVPFVPTNLTFHSQDGKSLGSYSFEDVNEGGDVWWVDTAGDALYLAQNRRLARLSPEVIDDE
jgi:outer membrane protein assembly factor BamB